MQLVFTIEDFISSPERMGELVGLAGAALYIGGFYMLQSGRICGNSIAYAASKVLAALLVLISLVYAFNLASCVIQIAYAGVGVYGIVRRLRGGAAYILPPTPSQSRAACPGRPPARSTVSVIA